MSLQLLLDTVSFVQFFFNHSISCAHYVVEISQITSHYIAGHSGLAVKCMTAVYGIHRSNLTVDACVFYCTHQCHGHWLHTT